MISLSNLFALTVFTAVSLLLGHLILLQFKPSPLDPLEWLMAAQILGLGFVGWLAFGLAELGQFNLGVFAVALFIIFAFLLARPLGQKRPFPPLKRQLPNAVYIALLIWLPIAAWLYLRPHQFLLGAADAGVYVNLAVHIADNGRILINPMTSLADVSELSAIFLRDLGPSSVAPYYLLPGFYTFSTAAVPLSPQFYHLQPVMQAIPIMLGGDVQAALLLPGFWALAASMAIFLTGRQAFGWPAALVTLTGLTFNALQIWFARYPTTEALSQLWLWGGIWGTTLWLSQRDHSRLWPLLGGTCFGLFFLTRIDAVLILPVLAGIGGWQVLTQRRRDPEEGGVLSAVRVDDSERELTQRHKAAKGEKKGNGRLPLAAGRKPYFWLPVLILFSHAMLHGYFQSRHYFLDLYGFGFTLLRFNPLLSLTAVLMVIILTALFYVNRHRLERLMRFQRQLTFLLLLLFAIFAIYTGLIRPFITPTLSWTDPFSGQIPILDHENMRRLGWYLSPVGVWAGAAGICLMIYKLNRKTAVSLLIPLLFTFVYIWNIRANPHQIYAMRRFVPAVMPLFIIGTAVVVHALWQQKAVWQKAAAVLLLLGWSFGLLWNARGFVTQVDYVNLPPQLAQLAHHFEKDSVILFNDQTPVGQGDILGTPLRFLYQHETFTLRQADAQTMPQLQRLVDQWQADGRAVYFVHVPPNQLDYLPAAMTYIETYTIETSRLEFSYAHKPTALQPLRWTADIYRIERVAP